MAKATESRSLKKVTEITHIAPLKLGYVESDLAVTYPTRLKGFLRVLNALRQYDVSAFQSPVDRLGLIHYARWTVREDRELVFTTNFDGSWESYIHAFVDTFPRLLDLIWSHCDGYAPETATNYRSFSEWVERHQVWTDTFYASYPDLTVKDIRWLRQLKENYDQFCRDVQKEADPAALAGLVDAFRRRVYDIDVSKPPPEIEPMPLKGRAALEQVRSFFQGKDELTFDRAVLELDPYGFHPRRASVAVPEKVSAPSMGLDALEASHNIQGGILRDYGWASSGRLILVQLETEQWGSFLESASERITTAASQNEEYALNLALTYSGLERLGLGEEELDSFPIEFRLGMERRADVLRDVGVNHPARWPNEITASRVDAVLIEHRSAGVEDASAETALDTLLRETGVAVVWEEPMQWPGGKKVEPFGFADGLSQPKLVTDISQPPPSDDPRTPVEDSPYRNVAAVGEFLLGQPNNSGEPEFRPRTPTLRNDGTYLVIRKLEQRQAAFDALVDENAGDGAPSPEELKALLMGRRTDGRLIDGELPAKNEEQPHPAGCPFHSHVRRSNPRDNVEQPSGKTVLPPRILRRAMPYGPEGNDGLMFMALNASIAAQYETIQQWVNGSNITGRMSTDPDPLISAADLDPDAMPPSFTYEHNGKVRTLVGLNPQEPPVRVRWGLYAFVPSLAALEYLSDPPKRPAKSSYLQLIRSLDRPGLEVPQRNLVKRLLEEVGTAPVTAPHLWQEVRDESDVVDTAYGTLVAKAEDVRAVLGDRTGVFSVSEYDSRMKATTGGFYLGYDESASDVEYQKDSAVANAYLTNLGRRRHEIQATTENLAASVLDAYQERASKLVQHEIAERRKRDLRYTEPIPELPIRLLEYGSRVLLEVSREYFGVPNLKKHTIASCLEPNEETRLASIRVVSAYIFYPNPEPFVEAQATEIAAKIREEVTEAVKQASASSDGNLIEHLLAVDSNTDVEHVASKVSGIYSGFFVPTLRPS